MTRISDVRACYKALEMALDMYADWDGSSPEELLAPARNLKDTIAPLWEIDRRNQEDKDRVVRHTKCLVHYLEIGAKESCHQDLRDLVMHDLQSLGRHLLDRVEAGT